MDSLLSKSSWTLRRTLRPLSRGTVDNVGSYCNWSVTTAFTGCFMNCVHPSATNWIFFGTPKATRSWRSTWPRTRSMLINQWMISLDALGSSTTRRLKLRLRWWRAWTSRPSSSCWTRWLAAVPPLFFWSCTSASSADRSLEAEMAEGQPGGNWTVESNHGIHSSIHATIAIPRTRFFTAKTCQRSWWHWCGWLETPARQHHLQPFGFPCADQWSWDTMANSVALQHSA